MTELIRQALREIADRPVVFVAELVQFAALAVIVWQLLRRSVFPTLAERRRKIAAQVEQANRAGELRTDAQARAEAIVAEARAQAARGAEAAAADANAARLAGLAAIERDASALVHQAEQTIAVEKQRVVQEASDELVGLIVVVVRRFLDESATESERRAMTQKLIADRLKELAP